jgi:hypothetical protein
MKRISCKKDISVRLLKKHPVEIYLELWRVLVESLDVLNGTVDSGKVKFGETRVAREKTWEWFNSHFTFLVDSCDFDSRLKYQFAYAGLEAEGLFFLGGNYKWLYERGEDGKTITSAKVHRSMEKRYIEAKSDEERKRMSLSFLDFRNMAESKTTRITDEILERLGNEIKVLEVGRDINWERVYL